MILLTHRVSSFQRIIPNLQIIKLQLDDSLTFDDEAFVGMVASRWDFDAAAVNAQVARLKTVHLSLFCHRIDISLESLRRLRAFRDEGLDICLSNESPNPSLLLDSELGT